MMGVLPGLGLPIAATWLLLRASGLRTRSDTPAVTFTLSVALGLGVASIAAFWFVVAGGTLGPRFVALDAAAWSLVALLSAWRLRVATGGARPDTNAPDADARAWRADGATRAAQVLFGLVALLALATLAGEHRALPYGQWDAWAVWNHKARFLFRGGGGDWATVLDVPWSNPPHPMLVSGGVARLWAWAGAEWTGVPAVLGDLMAVAIVTGVMGAIGLGRARAWLAGAVLLAPYTFLQQVAAQQADLPVALFVTAAVLVLYGERAAGTPGAWPVRALLLGGAVAGLGAWTKNEGVVFLAASGMLLAVDALRARAPGRLLWFGAGAAAALATVVAFKWGIAPDTSVYLPSGASQSAIDKVLSPALHATIGRIMLVWSVRWGGGPTVGLVPVLLAVAAWSAVVHRQAAARLLAVVGLMLAGYYVVYVLTPLDTEWLVTTTIDRLLVQLWPVIVLAAFLPRRPVPAGA